MKSPHFTPSGERRRCCRHRLCHRHRLAAISMPELLVVIALLSVMITVGASSMDGLFRGSGRRAAVEQVLGLLEQARVRALATGRPVYVAFADDTLPEGERWRAMALYEEGENPGSPLQAATSWVTLRGKMAFAKGGQAAPSLLDAPEEVDACLFTMPGGEHAALPYLKFNAGGGVDYPSHSTAAKLYIGWRKGGELELGEGYETIRVALFTGRAVFLAGQGLPETTTAGLGGGF